MKPYIPALIILIVVIAALGGWILYSNAVSVPASVAVTSTQTSAGTATSSGASQATSTSSGALSSSSGTQVYTLADIAQHSTASSCWLAIDGNVYDVTNFIPIHPGGKAILRGCGKDATALFHSVPSHAETNAEETVAPQYLIGTLAP
jgi:cytochrome b involved in lipid metabolism